MTALGASSRRVMGLAAVGAVAAAAAAGLATYPAMPARMAVHWTLGAGGLVADGFAPRAVGTFALPALAAAMLIGGRLVASALRDRDAAAASTLEGVLIVVLWGLAVAEVGLVVANL